MTPPLFLLEPLPPGDHLLLSGDEGRHAAKVKRLRAGEELFVCDGHGGLLLCRVDAVVGESLELVVVDRRDVAVPNPRLVVVQALPKGDRAELAVETMTELGVDEIVPWTASRSITQWRGARGEKALERWRRASREAAKQSRRAHVPHIAKPVESASLVPLIHLAAVALVLHEDASAPLASIQLCGSGDIVVIVGPEGGVSPDELAAFSAAGAQAVRLGDSVLRTSTAGPAALAALSLRLGRWG